MGKEHFNPIYFIVLVIFIFFIGFMMIGSVSVFESDAHYLGSIIITDNSTEIYLEQLIDKNADYGPINLLKPGYHIEITDGNITLLLYAFFSKDKNLPFTKSK